MFLDWASDQFKARSITHAVIITTAARLKEENEWAQVAARQLQDLGLPAPTFFDYERQKISDLPQDGLIYVNGGNTFRLMQGLATQHHRPWFDTFFANNGLYIGVSAGSAIMGSRIDHLSIIGMDPDEHNWRDKPSLGYYSGEILPHAGPEWSPPMQTLGRSKTLYITDKEAYGLDPTTGVVTLHLK